METGGKKGLVRQIWKAMRQLSPGKVTRDAERHFVLAVLGLGDEEVAEIRRFLLGRSPSAEDVKRAERVLRTFVQPLDDVERREVAEADIVLAGKGAEEGVESRSAELIVFDADDQGASLEAILNSKKGSALRYSLARHLPRFRPEVAHRIVRQVSLENAGFVIATALGNVMPTLFQPIVGAAEAAGDIVFLTANQVRMLFMIGACYGEKVGFVAQWKGVSSIVGAAFTWRALARNLVSKIPLGGGLVPKGAIAYAGTTSIGEGLIFFYTTGRTMSREEAAKVFRSAYAGAEEKLRSLAGRLRSRSRRHSDVADAAGS